MFGDFFQAMQVHAPPHARIMACQFRGDPASDIYGKWRVRVLNRPDMVDEHANVYLCVSAMQQNERGEWRRRKENFAGGLLLMIDDVGDGPGSKFPLSTLEALRPTCLVETSPNNFQATYFFDRLVDDLEEFDALIRAFIDKQFLGNDTGQAGVNRVFRPPVGVNGKPKYGGWRVVGHDWRPDCRYSPAEIADAFGLKPQRRVPLPRDPGTLAAFKNERIEAFIHAQAALRGAGMIKREEPDYSGWIQVQCPWTDEHTGAVDTGAAIRIPAEENEWCGAFRCHHGHCEQRGWRDLTEWLGREAEAVLDHVNNHAPTTWSFKQ